MDRLAEIIKSGIVTKTPKLGSIITGDEGRDAIHIAVLPMLAGGKVNCGNVGMGVDASGDVTCHSVGGDIDASGNVTVNGDVAGGIDASGNVKCGKVGGDIDASGSVRHG